MPVLDVQIIQSPFGVVSENGYQIEIDSFHLIGRRSGREDPVVQATVISLGANLVSLKVPDNQGNVADIVQGFDTLEEYLSQDSYLGATVGRNASRVGGSQFQLNGNTYRLAKNTEAGHLHGGIRGFDKHIWQAEVGTNSVTFSYFSRHGEEGYPGDVLAQLTYSLVLHNGVPSLSLQYRGLAASSTVLNMTHHSYFNLAGHGSGAVGLREHRLSINADRKLVLDGGIAKGKMTELGRGPQEGSVPQLMEANGGEIDDVFVLNDQGAELVRAASLSHPPSGRAMVVYTNQPAIVIYTANHFPVAPKGIAGKGGALYPKNGSIALETSGFPNAMNVPSFPSVILKPGDIYDHKCIYQLGA